MKHNGPQIEPPIEAVYDEKPYIPPTVRQLEEACATGERGLSGQALLVARLDMALAGLLQEFGEDYFLDDVFPDRFTAAEEIMAAARVFLEESLPEREQQEERVRLLYAEAETVLKEWRQLKIPKRGQSMLFAAEEPASLL